MSQTNIFVTQLAQLGYAERIAQEAQGHPEIARQTAEQAAVETLKRQKDSIAKTEKSGKSRNVKSEKDGGGSRGGAEGGNRRRASDEEREESEPAASPWAGNIVNLKV